MDGDLNIIPILHQALVTTITEQIIEKWIKTLLCSSAAPTINIIQVPDEKLSCRSSRLSACHFFLTEIQVLQSHILDVYEMMYFILLA